MNLEHRAEIRCDEKSLGDEPRVYIFQCFRHLVKTKELSPFSRPSGGELEIAKTLEDRSILILNPKLFIFQWRGRTHLDA